MPKDANTVGEITCSRGKNVRLMERLAESAERAITLQESVSSVDEEKEQVNTVSVSSRDSGESLFTVLLTQEVDSVHAIQSQIRSKITATMKLKGGLEITGATCDILKLSSIKGTKYANKITTTNQVLKMYSASTLRPL